MHCALICEVSSLTHHQLTPECLHQFYHKINSRRGTVHYIFNWNTCAISREKEEWPCAVTPSVCTCSHMAAGSMDHLNHLRHLWLEREWLHSETPDVDTRCHLRQSWMPVVIRMEEASPIYGITLINSQSWHCEWVGCTQCEVRVLHSSMW
jgi:hypothetical protein